MTGLSTRCRTRGTTMSLKNPSVCPSATRVSYKHFPLDTHLMHEYAAAVTRSVSQNAPTAKFSSCRVTPDADRGRPAVA